MLHELHHIRYRSYTCYMSYTTRVTPVTCVTLHVTRVTHRQPTAATTYAQNHSSERFTRSWVKVRATKISYLPILFIFENLIIVQNFIFRKKL